LELARVQEELESAIAAIAAAREAGASALQSAEASAARDAAVAREVRVCVWWGARATTLTRCIYCCAAQHAAAARAAAAAAAKEAHAAHERELFDLQACARTCPRRRARATRPHTPHAHTHTCTRAYAVEA
jgi:hypothetical protein